MTRIANGKALWKIQSWITDWLWIYHDSCVEVLILADATKWYDQINHITMSLLLWAVEGETGAAKVVLIPIQQMHLTKVQAEATLTHLRACDLGMTLFKACAKVMGQQRHAGSWSALPSWHITRNQVLAPQSFLQWEVRRYNPWWR